MNITTEFMVWLLKDDEIAEMETNGERYWVKWGKNGLMVFCNKYGELNTDHEEDHCVVSLPCFNNKKWKIYKCVSFEKALATLKENRPVSWENGLKIIPAINNDTSLADLANFNLTLNDFINGKWIIENKYSSEYIKNNQKILKS